MDYELLETENVKSSEPTETNNPGRDAANTIGWFIFLAVTTFGIIVVFNKGIRDIILLKVQNLTSRLHRRPDISTETEED
jgi:hypothetical protein